MSRPEVVSPEEWQAAPCFSPEDYPQDSPYAWWELHDEYET